MDDEKTVLLRELLKPESQGELVALARALCPFAETATDAMMLVCIALVEAKGDEKCVGAVLGMDGSRIRGHSQSRLASQIMRRLAKEKLMSTGYVKALAALQDVAGSESQTGTARRNAAAAIIELVNEEASKDVGNSDGGLDLNVMTLKELEGYVSSIKADLVQIPHHKAMID